MYPFKNTRGGVPLQKHYFVLNPLSGNGLQCLVAWRQTLVALALGIVEALRISLVAHTWPVSSGFERVPLVAHAQGSVA